MARSKLPVYRPCEVQRMIANGDCLIISAGYILRLNAWRERHPGGRLVIDHMVGRDATDEPHVSHSEQVLKSMKIYRIGQVDGEWENLRPPIQSGHDQPDVTRSHCGTGSIGETSEGQHGEIHSGCPNLHCGITEDLGIERPLLRLREGFSSTSQPHAARVLPGEYTQSMIQQQVDFDVANYPQLDTTTQRAISERFQRLHERVRREDFYVCRLRDYFADLCRYSFLFFMFLLCLRNQWFLISASFLGMFWHQIMFTAHDAGHNGITHHFVWDTLIGILIADFCCGLSIGWWKSSHDVHHFMTNDAKHDPDIQNLPLFATAPEFFTSLKSTYYNGFCFAWDAAAAVMVRYQRLTYYPIMAVARFNLYILSWSHLLSPRSTARGRASWIRPTELVAMACYSYLFLYVLIYRNIPTWWDRAGFVLVSHLVTMPLHVQITLSHWGTSTADLGPGESFAQRQLRTTMDVTCPAWMDFLHGGLQFQAVHHLFPRVPRHNLRRLQVLVKEFCKQTKIQYLELGFLDGNEKVLNKLGQVANQATILAACQAHLVATGTGLGTTLGGNKGISRNERCGRTSSRIYMRRV